MFKFLKARKARNEALDKLVQRQRAYDDYYGEELTLSAEVAYVARGLFLYAGKSEDEAVALAKKYATDPQDEENRTLCEMFSSNYKPPRKRWHYIYD
jgi:hypothetical protein